MSVPGKAGAAIEELVDHSVALGSAVVARLAHRALERLLRFGEAGVWMSKNLLAGDELVELADALAAAIGTAELLGRSRIRQAWEDVLRHHGVDPVAALAEGRLDVPSRLQTEDYSCGAAALRMVLAYFGVDLTERALIAELGSHPDAGTPPDALIHVARAHGLEAEGQAGLTIADLQTALDAGCPVLCCIQAWGTAAQARRELSGHWVVVTGYDALLHLQDPVAGEIAVSPAEFDALWHDRDARGQRYDHYGIVCNGPRPVVEAVTPLPPEEAARYFGGLVPTLGVDPERFGQDLRRRAFTLAVATDQEILQRIQRTIHERLASGQGVSSGAHAVQGLLDAAGVTPANPQYAEMVFRTNVKDAYNTAATAELQSPQVARTFPVWQYTNAGKPMSRPSHKARAGNYYPASVPFVQVRGTSIADSANCTCDQIPIDKWTWAKRKAAGARIADGYPDVPGEEAPTPPVSPVQAPAPGPTPPPNPGPTPAPAPPAPVGPAAFTPVQRAQDAEAWVRQTFPHIQVDFSRMHVDALNPTVAQLDRLTREFGAVADRLRQFGKDPNGTIANAYAWASRDGKRIGLNPGIYADPARLLHSLKNQEAARFNPPGCDSIEYVLTHEFGHQVDHWIQSVLTGADLQAYQAFRTRLHAQAHRICRYAMKNEQEAFAEAFSMFYHSPAGIMPTEAHELRHWIDLARRATGGATP